MSNHKDSILTFIVTLNLNGSQKQSLLIYRHVNKALTILDIKTHKQLYPQNSLILIDKTLIIEELVIGKKLQILINQTQKGELQIIGYADEYTKNILLSKTQQPQSVLVIIKPGFIENKKLGEIFSVIQTSFTIKRFKMFIFTIQNLSKYIVNQKLLNSQNNQNNIAYLSSGPSFGLQITGNDQLLTQLRKILGPQNPIVAKKSEPLTLRAKYGSNIIQNCCHSSKNQKAAQLELQFIFSDQVKQCLPKISKTLLCLIKPHIIEEKKVGKLITFLLSKNAYLNSMRLQVLKPHLLKEYFDFYKFLPQYEQNIQNFKQGRCIYIQISLNNSLNFFEDFKNICGPYDPSYAKKINPQSLRAIFGTDRSRNAVHCTELLEDCENQIKLLFQL